jgi:hypothetical protein
MRLPAHASPAMQTCIASTYRTGSRLLTFCTASKWHAGVRAWSK